MAGHVSMQAFLWRFVVVCLIVIAAPGSAGAAHTDDRFIAGYATAVLERDFHLSGAIVRVENGVIILQAGDLAALDRDEVIAALTAIHDVLRVEIREGASPDAPGPVAQHILPAGKLFDPLLADPRWPHFSMAYHRYLRDRELRNAGTVSFGETVIFFRDRLGAGQWEVGLQGAVFAVFDLDASSMDLINADYWIGIPVSYRYGRFSSLFRVFHQSSHLGDEFLLRSRVERVNLSYESLDLKLSYDVARWLRIYGGGSYIFHREPSDLNPWSTQAGIELKSPSRFFGVLRPLAALDIKNWEEHNWSADLSARAGVQIESWKTTRHKVQFMLEYFKGHSPHGQFFDRSIEYLGVGAHFYF